MRFAEVSCLHVTATAALCLGRLCVHQLGVSRVRPPPVEFHLSPTECLLSVSSPSFNLPALLLLPRTSPQMRLVK